MQPIATINLKCDPHELKNSGPMVPASWGVSIEREAELKSKGLQPPVLVQGYLLLDTGAAHIAIDEDVTKELQIEPFKTREVFGIGGNGVLHVYKASLLLPVRDIYGRVSYIRTPVEPWGTPQLAASHTKFGLRVEEGKPARIIGVLGRIFLQFVTLTYNGLAGQVDMVIDESVQRPKS